MFNDHTCLMFNYVQYANVYIIEFCKFSNSIKSFFKVLTKLNKLFMTFIEEHFTYEWKFEGLILLTIYL